MTGPYRGDPQFEEVRRENCQEVVTVLSFLSDLPPVAVWPASYSRAVPLDCPGVKHRCQRLLSWYGADLQLFSRIKTLGMGGLFPSLRKRKPEEITVPDGGSSLVFLALRPVDKWKQTRVDSRLRLGECYG